MTLVETLVYVGVLAGIFLIVVNTILLLGGSQSRLAATRALNRSARVSLERMTHEISQSASVDLAGSVLGASPGALALVRQDGGTTAFALDGGTLAVSTNGAAAGELTDGSVAVSSLVFRRIVAASGAEGVRIEMTLAAGEKSETFYATALLRGSL